MDQALGRKEMSGSRERCIGGVLTAGRGERGAVVTAEAWRQELQLQPSREPSPVSST